MRLFRTTAFRLSLVYACVYSLLSALGLGFTYWSTASRSMAQIDERLRLETGALINRHAHALPALIETIQGRNSDDGSRKFFFYRLEGPTRQRPDALSDIWPEGLESAYATVRLSDVFQIDQADADTRVRVLATRLPNGYRLLVGRDLNDEQALMDHTLKIVIAVIGITFLLATLGSIVLGRYTLRRIDAFSRTAGDIMAGNLGKRIPLGGRDDEFNELGQRLNAMLERIEQLMAAMRQVTENVAHDLRSPLNRLRTRLEVTLLEARNPAEYRDVLEQALVDTDGLLQTFNALLSIARAEAGIQRTDWTTLDLAALAEELADLYGALAEEKNVRLLCEAPEKITLRGHRQLLAQALSNLLDNAVKYTPAGGQIMVAVGCLDRTPVLTVADNGPGIPAAQRDAVTERFTRLDNARSTPGNGLGLSLVKAVAQLHEAELILADNQPGLRVTLRFAAQRSGVKS